MQRSTSYKIVTWNLSFTKNLELANDALTNVEELMDEGGVEFIAMELGYTYVYYQASIHPRHKKNFGNAELTKWEITHHDKVLLPKSGSDRKHTRNAVKATINVADLVVTAYSVHLETFWIFQRSDQRQAAYINQLFEQDDNIIVGGDFNSLSNGSIEYLERIFASSGLFRLSAGTGYTFKYLGLKLTLDHLFSSPAESIGSGVWREVEASDHSPIWSVIRLK